MGGGWFGYVFSIFGCGVVLSLIAGATAALYAWARLRGGKPEARVRVRSLASGTSSDTSPTPGSVDFDG